VSEPKFRVSVELFILINHLLIEIKNIF
jgi:hypothetical protein